MSLALLVAVVASPAAALHTTLQRAGISLPPLPMATASTGMCPLPKAWPASSLNKASYFAVKWKENNLALVGEDGWLEVWDTKDVKHLQLVFSIPAHEGIDTGLSFDISGRTLLTCYFDLQFAGIPDAKGKAATNLSFPQSQPALHR